MNITLRKANAIQHSIQEVLKNISVQTTVELNEFQNVEAELQRANDEAFKNDARRQKLLLAYYNIRGLVAAANAQSGIDLALTKSAFVDKRVSQLDDIANSKAISSLDEIKGKLEKIRNRTGESRMSLYGREEVVSTSVIAQSQIDQAKAEILNLKKQKQKLNDEILEINIKTEIPLSEDVMQTLQAEGLI